MTCEETQHLLNAYMDDELEWSVRLVIESHLQGCSPCSSALASLKALVSAVERARLKFKAPPQLKTLVQSGIQQAPPAVRRSFTYRHWVGSAAAVVLIAALFWAIPWWTTESSLEERLAGEIVSNHVRSMMADHLTDVLSSDTHNVKPWFAEKLDYSPQVKDLTAQGFPLLGGRMDYLGNRPVAALVYQRNQHLINLFVWPSDQSSPDRRSAMRGYNLIHWTQSGMTYWIVSDLNPAELNECAGLLRE